jgi:hypothetical protein
MGNVQYPIQNKLDEHNQHINILANTVSFVLFVLKFTWTFKFNFSKWIVHILAQMSIEMKNIRIEDRNLDQLPQFDHPTFHASNSTPFVPYSNPKN